MDAILSYLPALPQLAVMADALRNPRSLFVVLVGVALVLYGLSVGRTRALVSLFSIYVAYMLAVLFPYHSWLTAIIPEQYRSLTGIALFIALYAITFALLSSSMLKGRLTLGEISFAHVVVISVVQIGLLASICVSLVPADQGAQLMGPMYRWFGGQRVLWAWAIASLLIMPFMRANRRSAD